MTNFKPQTYKHEMPRDFSDDIVKTIKRIESNCNVIGVLFFRAGVMELHTVPDTTAQKLVTKLPRLNEVMQRAVTEIDIQDELVAYRVVANSFEVTVVADQLFCACVVHKLTSRRHKKPHSHQHEKKK